MLSSSHAEWMLARFVGQEQSATLIGDLLEQRTERGAWWFWRSFSCLLLSVAWRPVLGFVAAVVMSASAYNALMTRIMGIWVTSAVQTTMLASMAAWFIAVYAGVRYGLRDALSHVASVEATLFTISTVLWPHPMALESVAAVALSTALVFIVMPSHRAAIGTLLATGVVFFVGFSLVAYSSDFYVRYVLQIKLLGSPELQQHPSIQYVTVGLQLFFDAVTAIVCAKLHRRFVLGRNQEFIVIK